MRRPLALFGFTFLGCSLWYVFFGAKSAEYAVGFFALAVVVLLFLGHKLPNDRKIQSLQGCCLAAFCAFSLMLITTAYWVAPLAGQNGSACQLQMTVIRQDGEYDTAAYYVVEAEGLYEERSQTALIRLETDRTAVYYPGEILRGQVVLEEVTSQNRGRLYSDRIWLTATPKEDTVLTVVGVEQGIPYYADMARSYIKNFIDTHLSGDLAALVAGICLGDVTGLSMEVSNDFYACGMGHIVAVSGLHTGTVGGWLVTLLLLMKTGKRYAKAISILFVWVFVLIVGAPFSAMRAGIMFTVLAAGTLFYRLPDMLNTLGAAVLVILLLYPFGAGDIGFLASVSACLGIILLADPMTDALLSVVPGWLRRHKGASWCAGAVGVTTSAFLANLPCNLLCFYEISLISAFANLPGVFLAGLVLILGLAGALIGLVPGMELLAQGVLVGSGLCAKALIGVARFFAGFPLAQIPFVTLWCFLGFVLMVVGGSLLYIYRSRLAFWVKRGLAVLLVTVMICTSFIPFYSADRYEVMVIGNGHDAVVAVAGKEGTVVIGCYSPYKMQTVLGSRGIRHIDRLILPNRQSYYQNIKDCFECFSVSAIHVYGDALQNGLLTGHEGKYQTLSVARRVTLGGIQVVANADFTVFTITVNGRQILYADSDPPGEGNYSYGIYHPTVTGLDGFWIGNEQGFLATQTVILKVTPTKMTWYEPRFVFG